MTSQKHEVNFSANRTRGQKLKRANRKSRHKGQPNQTELNYILDLFKNAQYQEVEKLALSLTKRYPSHHFGWKILELMYRSTNNLADVLKAARRFSELNPSNADAKYNLGKILDELGNPEAAITCYLQSINLRPDFVHGYFNLANAFKTLGKLEEAIIHFKEAIRLRPNEPNLHSNLGTVFQELGHLDQAEDCYKKSIQLKPNDAVAYNNLGSLQKEMHEFENALSNFSNAVKHNPDFTTAYINMAVVFQLLNRPEEAEERCLNALEIDPNFPEAHFNLGVALQSLSNLASAKRSYKRAIELKPHYVEAHNNLGNVHRLLGEFSAAEMNFKQILELQPTCADALFNLGSTLTKLNRTDEALICYEKVYGLNPKMDYLLGDLLFAKLRLCHWNGLEERIGALHEIIDAGGKGCSPFALQSLIECPQSILKATEIYSNHINVETKKVTMQNEKENASLNFLPSIDNQKNRKKIRLGYFSPDFHDHPVAKLMLDLFKCHDRSKFEVHAFYFGPGSNDEWNQRIRESVMYFHNIQSMSDKDIASLTKSLKIDIAIDLTGYTSNNRVTMFSHTLAPIQASYIGFLGTMGSEYYDYLIADRVLIPEESLGCYSEKIVYLPSYQVNSSLPCEIEDHMDRDYFNIPKEAFVFGCFNNSYKISPAAVDSWSKILKNVPDSVLLMYVKDNLTKKNLRNEFISRGINPEQILFSGSLTGTEYWSRFKSVDLALDTFLVNGGATSSDILRMGCPLISYKGESFSSRMGASLLTALELPELITSNQNDYESLAITLGNDKNKLLAISKKVASKRNSSLLYNVKQFAKSIETAYVSMLDKSVKNEEPCHIYITN